MSAERLRADVFRLRRRKFAWAVPLLLVLAVLLVAALAFNLANLDTGGESIPQATAPGGPASRAGVFVPDPIATILLTVLSAFFLVGSVLVGLGWLVYLLRRSRRPDPEWETAFPIPIDRQAAVVAVRATIRDLEEGGDVRTAILACFERFCALLGSRGITDQDALTPHEL